MSTARCRAPCSRSSAVRRARRSRTFACSRERSGRAIGCRVGAGDERKVTAISVFERGSARPHVRGRRRADRQALGPRRCSDRRRDRRRAHRRASVTTSRRRRWRRSSSRVARRPGRAPRRARSARRAGPADQPPPGRRPAGDCSSRSTARCRRRSSRRRWRTTSASTSTSARRRRSASNGRSAPARRSRSSARRRTRSSPPSGCGSSPARVGSGVEFRLEVELGSMPLSFHKAVEETVRETLHQGICGWQVTDCTVTMTHSGYWARPGSTAGDFRNLTPLVLMSALQQAGTMVCEPIHRFHLEIPSDTLGPMLPVLARLHAVPRTPEMRGSSCTLEGEIPAARVHELQQQLPALTRGEGVLECAFDSLPAGARRDPDPAAVGPQPAQPQGVPAARPRRRQRRRLTPAPTANARRLGAPSSPRARGARAVAGSTRPRR